MLTLLLGKDWTENRNEILNLISADVAAEKSDRILIVPELISHDTERRLCKAAGDTCSRFAEVLSFPRLAKRVSEYNKKPIRPCLDQGGRLVAMASAIRQVHSKLKAYASVETRPEFFSGLLDAVDEFKRCCISSEDLKIASVKTEGSLAQKLEELSLILESYDSVCALGKCDPRDQMVWLLEELEVCQYADKHVFYVDGFPDFTRQHLNILNHLIKSSQDVTVSLTCDELYSDNMAFSKAGETAGILKQMAIDSGVETRIVYIPSKENELSVVKQNLFEGQLGDKKSAALKTIRTNTVYQECESAVETILGYVIGGARYRDINIVCSDMSVYRNTLEMLFEKANIPIYISGNENILDQPAIATLLFALETVVDGFETQNVLRYVKSMLSPLGAEDCDLIENYAVLWGINGKSWEKEWVNHPDGLDGRWTEDAKNLLHRLNIARKCLVEPLVRLRTELDQASNLGQMVVSLYNFLNTISYDQKLEKFADAFAAAGNGRDAQVLNQLWNIILTALEQLYDTLGQTKWDNEGFLRILKLLISQYDVGTIPPVLDAVSVGPTNVMRCQQCKYLLVLGVSEGDMPGYAGTVGVLTDQERVQLRQLGVPLTGGSLDGLLAELADIYGVFCGADEEITVYCSSVEPSFIYKRLAAISNGEVSPELYLGAALANKDVMASYLLRYNNFIAADELAVLPAYKTLELCKKHNIGTITAENIVKLYGKELNLSASRIDRQALCRLAYFLQYGLYAKERKTIEIDPAEFGTYVHAVLEKTVRRVMLEGGIRSVTVEEMVSIAKQCAEEYSLERFSMLETDRAKYLFQRNWDELEKIVCELWAEMQNTVFEPVGLEVGFGDGYEIPAIDISGNDMSGKLKGFVDRVDAWEDAGKTYYRVVDYKTGKKDFDYCDILNGYGMQMLLYLFALQENGSNVIGDNPVPAGVQYFPARVPLISANSVLSEAEAGSARQKLLKRKGLVLSDETVLAAMENTDKPIRMPYTRKKDGSLSGDLADHKQFAQLRKFVSQRVGKMVDEIASGDVSANPYSRGTGFSACTYCPYDSVCHKASIEKGRNYRSISEKEFWESIEKEVGDNG